MACEQPCARCGGRSQIRITRPAGLTEHVCSDCLAAVPRSDVARFFALLTNPRPTQDRSDSLRMDAETACSGCGVTYGEFARIGLVGCSECYSAFRPAIAQALELLHGADARAR